jgi:putative Mg2+ transporter-C (MgtC) family protein
LRIADRPELSSQVLLEVCGIEFRFSNFEFRIFLMTWLTANWKTLLQPPLAQAALAIVALFCGAIIGSDRQRRDKPVGLRTLILVCLGSAAFTMAGGAFKNDDGRVAAQVVTGIGFLGAGVILHPRGTISGATTAAAIWVTASVGMLAGAGYAGGALGMTLLVRLVLGVVTVYEARTLAAQPPVLVTLDFDPSEGRTRVRMERILVDYAVDGGSSQWTNLGAGMDRLALRLHLSRHHLRELLDDLVEIPEVKRVREECPSQAPGAQPEVLG